MSDLTSSEKLKLEKFFGMESGYVLDFSNRSFQEFLLENIHVDINQPRYEKSGTSKANRLRTFWKIESNMVVGKSILKLLDYWQIRRELNNQVVTLSEKALYDECIGISERLLSNMLGIGKYERDIEISKSKEVAAQKDNQLLLLLRWFDDMANSNDYQKRGFFLQDLLNKLFLIHEIPVVKSFQRNDGGEQIDGAFSYRGWHYIVECKWTRKLSDIRDLDSLSGKVARSGRQSMGLFLSIEGWSENVPILLKQNPDKSIILMEGYDLRTVLCGGLELERLLDAKLAKLNIESEPFFSAAQILKGK